MSAQVATDLTTGRQCEHCGESVVSTFYWNPANAIVWTCRGCKCIWTLEFYPLSYGRRCPLRN